MLINLDVELVELRVVLLALTKVATLADKWDMKMDAILAAMSAEMPITRFTTYYIKSYTQYFMLDDGICHDHSRRVLHEVLWKILNEANVFVNS